jgi:signal transduction histidine kinase
LLLVNLIFYWLYADQKKREIFIFTNRAESSLLAQKKIIEKVADLRTDLAQGLPMIPCYPSELNQVFLNVIINGAHAIDEKQTSEGNTQKGTITVSTLAAENHLEIRIQDTGAGVPDHIKTQIFDPFFTTKEIGKGTGQGLAIANSIVVDKHGGKLSFESQEGSGTTFIIQLPLEAKEATTDS